MARPHATSRGRSILALLILAPAGMARIASAEPPAVRAPPTTSHLQSVLYSGVNSLWGEDAARMGPGWRVGGLVGWRLANRLFVPSVEITIDQVNFRGGAPQTEFALDLAVSPYWVIPVDAGTSLMLGMKVGGFLDSYDGAPVRPASHMSTSAIGMVAGLNVAVTTTLGRRESVGVLLSALARQPTYRCLALGASSCQDYWVNSRMTVLAAAAILVF
jgi:hypothetical protein